MTSTIQLTPLRYEMPTVTLEVMAREAALSQWSEIPVVQVLRFQLQVRSFDGGVAPVDIRGDRDTFFALQRAIQPYIQSQLTGEKTMAGDRTSNLPYLEAEGLTRHRLYLGNLKTQSGETSVPLGAIQLADLGDVLEQLDTQVRLLPISLTPSVRRRPWRQWGAIAASMVAAVGLTTTLWPFYQSQDKTNQTALEAPLADQEVSSVPASPERLESSRPAEAIPPPTEESADGPESDVSSEATETIRSQPENLDLQPTPEPTTKANQPNPGSSASSNAPAPKPTLGPSTPSPANRDEDAAASSPAPTEPDPPADPVPPATPDPISESEGLLDREVQTAPETEAADEDFVSSDRLTQETPAAANRGPNPGVSDAQRGTQGADAASATSAMPDRGESLVLTPESTAQAESLPLPETPAEASAAETAAAVPSFATLAAEISEQWVPPADLTRTLTYTLTLKADGTLAEIIPNDDLAAQYRDRAGLPSLGTPILSSPSPSQLRVLLYPSGNAQVIPVAP
ncbi:MAG: DUF4335 domain-containing protein [Leptolyngbyaceae cyanobacterium]